MLRKNAFSDEAASFHFAMKHCSVTLHNMKHSAYAPYVPFLFPAANREHVTGKEKFFSYGACNLATGSLYYRQLHPGEMGSEDFDVFSVWSVRNLETSA